MLYDQRKKRYELIITSTGMIILTYRLYYDAEWRLEAIDSQPSLEYDLKDKDTEIDYNAIPYSFMHANGYDPHKVNTGVKI